MTVLLLSSTLGVLFGYIMTTQFIEKVTWQYSFYTQIVAVIPIIIALLCTPIRYLDLKLAAAIKAGYRPEEHQEEQRQENGKRYRPVTGTLADTEEQMQRLNTSSPDFFTQAGRGKSNSFEKFGFHGSMFQRERTQSAHLSMNE